GAPTPSDDLAHVVGRDGEREPQAAFVGRFGDDDRVRVIHQLAGEELDELPHVYPSGGGSGAVSGSSEGSAAGSAAESRSRDADAAWTPASGSAAEGSSDALAAAFFETFSLAGRAACPGFGGIAAPGRSATNLSQIPIRSIRLRTWFEGWAP